jgi:hypothetical protein
MISSLAGIVSAIIMGCVRIQYLPYRLVPLVPTVDPRSQRQEQIWLVFIIPVLAVTATFIMRLRDGMYKSDLSDIYAIGAFITALASWAFIEGLVRIRTKV